MSLVVCHVDTENGRGSIADLIEAGKVISFDGSTYEKAERVYWALYNGSIKADVVVLDTLTTLVDRYVSEMTLVKKSVSGTGNDTWYNAFRDHKTRTNQDIWGAVNTAVGMLTTGFRNLPQPSIFLAHETERDDPTAEIEVDRHMPALTPKILKGAMAYSDLVMRIFKSPTPFAIDGVQYAANTRVLQLENTANAYTGVRLTPSISGALPQYIPEPTLAKLAAAIGYLPKAMTMYGFPKVGKTVLACTMPS